MVETSSDKYRLGPIDISFSVEPVTEKITSVSVEYPEGQKQRNTNFDWTLLTVVPSSS